MNIDFYLFRLINSFAGKDVCLDATAIFFAKYLQYILIFFLILFLFKNFKKHFRIVIFALLTAIFARFVIVEIIRYFIPRPRPFIGNHINLLFAYNPNEPSFPSGHATFFFALSTFLYFYNKKAGIGFLIASFLISISRVFAGIHWPSDILAGAIVGILSGWFIFLLTRKFFLVERK